MAEQQMISAIASKKFDVFISFRGEDTRMNFTSHLHEALKQKKVETYIDYRLEKGAEISTALIKAIEDSHVSVVVLSENYAFSKWCLEELSKIMECNKNQRQVVIPVFYNIDPSHVRKQTGSYEQAFAKYEGEGEPRCNKWRAALTELANLAGWDSRNRNESELLKDIVRDILRKLTSRYPNQLKGLVGIEDSYEQIESLVRVGSSEVRTIGIWGMGGIGKTTLATALYANLCAEFDVGCFLANVRENSSRPGGLEELRNKLFAKLLENENHCFDAPFLVPGFAMRRLEHNKVFIVLDDVASIQQLEYLIKDCDSLGPRSRVIVTTRDKQIFRPDDKVYEVKKLSFHHSLQLFCLTVFEEKQPKHGYEDLSRSAISCCQGIPLALKVLGASLRRRSKVAWQSELRKLKKIPNVEIHNLLKLSYDGLDRSQKNIFLDIACFFRGGQRDQVTNLLEACDFFAASGMEVLLDKALIEISDCNRIEMHDLIQQMGHEVVYQESIKDLRRQSRLWKLEDVHQVLKYDMGTDVVEGLALDLRQLTGDLYLSSNCFTKMTNMRFLNIHDSCSPNRFSLYLPNGLESLSNKLRYLRWDGFCLESLPSNFCAEHLVELRMPQSRVKKLWDGVQNLVNLKEIDLHSSRDLTEIPDLSKAEKLARVSLECCVNLRQLHPSMSYLPKLQILCFSYCRKLESLHVNSKYLIELHLNDCSSLKEFSVTSVEMTNLDLPDIYGLRSLNWKLPYECMQRQQNALNISFLQALIHNIGHFSFLHMLNLSGTSVITLPTNIKILWTLRRLYLTDCRKLVCLPELPPFLETLCAHNCTCLDTDFTQRLVIQHMLHGRIPYYLNSFKSYYDCGFFMFPGDHVIEDCSFRTTGSSITIPYLPSLSDLCGFIYCIIISKESCNLGPVTCSIYHNGKRISMDGNVIPQRNFISDHVFFAYVEMRDLYMPFQFEFNYSDPFGNEQSIKECGVFPLYVSELGLKLIGSTSKETFEPEFTIQKSDNESRPREIGVGVSCIENEQDSEELLPAGKKRLHQKR